MTKNLSMRSSSSNSFSEDKRFMSIKKLRIKYLQCLIVCNAVSFFFMNYLCLFLNFFCYFFEDVLFIQNKTHDF